MSRKFHLLIDFDHVWQVLRALPDQGRRLAAYLADQPRVHLTWISKRSLEEASRESLGGTDLLPHSWICEGGKTLHHLRPDRTYASDQAFRMGVEWLGGETEGCNRKEVASPALAALYHGVKGMAPRPRVVVGDPQQDRGLLRIADIPIPVRLEGADLEARIVTKLRRVVGERSPAVPAHLAAMRSAVRTAHGISRLRDLR